MMNFSDETVEKVAKAISISMMNARIWNSLNGTEWTAYAPEAQAALSSLTLADLMQVEEVRALVEAGSKVMSNYLFVVSAHGAGETIRNDFLNLRDKLTPFTEPKQ